MNSADNKYRQRVAYEPVGDHVRIFKRRRYWYANYQAGGRQYRVALATTNKVVARRKAEVLDAQLASGVEPGRRPAVTVVQAVEQYTDFLRTDGRSKKTIVKYQGVLNRFADLCERRDVRLLNQVNLQVMDAFRSERVSAGREPKTVYTETVVIRQLVNFAVSREMIDRDVLKGLKLKKPKPTRQPCWTREEMDRIVGAAVEPVRSCLVLLAETGMRVGELVHLTWDDIGLDCGFIWVRAKAGWKPKTGDERKVPVSRAARIVLERLPRRGSWVVMMPPTKKYPVLDRMVSDRWLLSRLKTILRRLGLPGHLHTFRHSFISHALSSGIAEATVREWVGHVDPEILKQYTHIFDDVSSAAMGRLDSGRDDEGIQDHETDDPTTLAG